MLILFSNIQTLKSTQVFFEELYSALFPIVYSMGGKINLRNCKGPKIAKTLLRKSEAERHALQDIRSYRNTICKAMSMAQGRSGEQMKQSGQFMSGRIRIRTWCKQSYHFTQRGRTFSVNDSRTILGIK